MAELVTVELDDDLIEYLRTRPVLPANAHYPDRIMRLLIEKLPEPDVEVTVTVPGDMAHGLRLWLSRPEVLAEAKASGAWAMRAAALLFDAIGAEEER